MQYNKVKNIDVQYLLTQAHWFLLIQEKDIQQQKNGLVGFIRKYQTSTEDRVKVMVVMAMFLKIRVELSDLREHEILEDCNNIIDYSYDIYERTTEVYKALVFAYWFKAQKIRKKDWRKSQHFYNRVSEFCVNIHDDEHGLYKIKAQLAKITLHLQYGESEQITHLFYHNMNKFVGYSNLIIINLIDEMIDLYIQYLASEDEWFYQAEQSTIFIEYLTEHPDVQKIILNSLVTERAIPRLFWIAYAYWGADQELWCEKYLLRYYSFVPEWGNALNDFKEYLQFNTAKDRKAFLAYAEDLYKRHISLEKYRKLFRSDRSKA